MAMLLSALLWYLMFLLLSAWLSILLSLCYFMSSIFSVTGFVAFRLCYWLLYYCLGKYPCYCLCYFDIFWETDYVTFCLLFYVSVTFSMLLSGLQAVLLLSLSLSVFVTTCLLLNVCVIVWVTVHVSVLLYVSVTFRVTLCPSQYFTQFSSVYSALIPVNCIGIGHRVLLC
jgi:hypothetical protein